jgi:3-oxoacyl-[acyl-carrier protein] reductase
MELLENRAAIVTGGARGIGREVARRFLVEGAMVVLADRDEDAVSQAAADLVGEFPMRVSSLRCDVTSESDVDGLVKRCTEEFGSLDVMVNNAGILRDATMRKMTLEDFRAVIDVHLQGTWLGTRAAAAVMRERGRGSIINMSSISGKVGMAGQTNYSAAKAGVVGLSKAAAKELAHLNIRVNVVQPGLINSPLTKSLREDVWKQKLSEVPMGRVGEPEDVAGAVLFLASDLSAYVTGTVLEVTGGRHM